MKENNLFVNKLPEKRPDKRFLLNSLTAVILVFVNILFVEAKSDYHQTEVLSVTSIMNDAQQQKRITGKVVDTDNIPVIGVNVIETGTTNGTVTDADGNFSLEVRSNATIHISYIGYLEQDVDVSAGSNFNITLQEDTKALEEIIVVGYGIQKKTTLTGSVSTVKGDELAKLPVPNVSQALAGKVAGVITNSSRGVQPGMDTPDIHVRGIATTGNNRPLIVVDGIKRDNIQQIDPATIENITILKDAAAVAPYGIGGANGVILITTKKGQSGAPVVRLNTSYGVQNPTYMPKMLDATDYMFLQNEGYFNLTPDGTTPPNNPELIGQYKDLHNKDPYRYPDSKFIDVWNMNAPQTKHYLELSGSSGKVNYHSGLGYYNQKGIFDPVGYQRFNYNLSLEMEATKTTKVSMSLYGSSEITKDLDPGENATGHLFRAFYKFVPTQQLIYPDGEHWGESSASSPVAALRSKGYEKWNKSTLLGMVSVEQQLPFIPGLSVKGVFSYDPTNETQKGWHLPFKYHIINLETNPYTFTEAVTTQEGGSPTYIYLSQQYRDWKNFTGQFFVNYARTFGNHNFTGLLVAEGRKNLYNTFWVRRNRFALEIDEIDFGSSNKLDYDNGGSSSEGSEIGYVYRFGYTYQDKYILEASGRYDGHYYFAPGARWGYFPSFSAAWRISEEKFMDGINTIDNLKLRASWGKSGMLAGSAFQYMSGYRLRGNAYLFGTSGMVQGSNVVSEANPNITWEMSSKTNIGFDLNAWGNLLNLEFDYFHENRSGMLLAPQVTLPVEYGLALSQENAGSMKNDGFEITLGTRKTVNKDFEFGISGNLTYAKNRMIEVFETDAERNNPNRTLRNRPFGTPFGYKALGLFSTSEDKNGDGIINADDGYNVTQFGNLHPGDIKYADLSGPDGVPDGRIDANDRHPIGNPVYPLMTFGLTPDLRWKNFDVSLFFQGSALSSINIRQYMTVPFENNGSNTSYEYFNNRWTPDTQDAKYPRSTPSPYNNNVQDSDWWTVNSSFLRLKTMVIGYQVPKSFMDKLGIAGVRIYYTGQNLLTFSGIKHIDPEMGWDSREESYPVMQTHIVGLDITF